MQRLHSYVNLKAITISRLEAKFADKFYNGYKEGKCLSAASLCSTKNVSVRDRHHIYCDTRTRHEWQWSTLHQSQHYFSAL